MSISHSVSPFDDHYTERVEELLTPYERAGIAWWNGLSLRERARWFKVADTCVVAEAYACHCAILDAFDGSHEEAPTDLAERERYHRGLVGYQRPNSDET